MDTSGDEVARQLYYPLGGTRWESAAPLPTGFQFTGQRNNAYIKLTQMGARWYDPQIRRFVQADSIVPNPGNPQNLNRYSYVLNNSLKYIDPIGHLECGAACPGDTYYPERDWDFPSWWYDYLLRWLEENYDRLTRFENWLEKPLRSWPLSLLGDMISGPAGMAWEDGVIDDWTFMDYQFQSLGIHAASSNWPTPLGFESANNAELWALGGFLTPSYEATWEYSNYWMYAGETYSAFSLEGWELQGHHTYPQALGGHPDQPLAYIPARYHTWEGGIYSDLARFEGGWLRPKRGMTGAMIVAEYGQEAVVEGLRRFYSQPRWLYLLPVFEAAVEFTIKAASGG